jgi:hypothetical protein
MGLSYLGSTMAWEEENLTKNGGVSVKHKYLSRLVLSEAGVVEQYNTDV